MRAGQDCAEIGVGRQDHCMPDGSPKSSIGTARVARAPTFAECMRMMRRRDPQVQEDGFHGLLGRSEHLDALVGELAIETDHGLRCWLLELIGETGRSDAVPVLAEYLISEDEAFRSWAVHGLQRIDTSEARSLLWEARQRHS